MIADEHWFEQKVNHRQPGWMLAMRLLALFASVALLGLSAWFGAVLLALSVTLLVAAAFPARWVPRRSQRQLTAVPDAPEPAVAEPAGERPAGVSGYYVVDDSGQHA